MKKRKTYEVSVINKTYSKTISDETKFYTSDTALELGFELKETEYNFESAEIVLLNVDDRSLITRTVAKSLDSFTYELENDIIAHYGEWRGQLRFEQAGETYVSSPVKFRIENDLSNDRPPQLSDVQSWVSLKRYADDLIDELKQAVLSVEGIEDTFNENELERQSRFENAEQSRQTTFETNESKRDATFIANESTRQAQELERENAESQRQQAESQRQSTFETNETERQTTFETSEQERQSAELIRVENENQRKIDHANRSAELDGKANSVIYEYSPTLLSGYIGGSAGKEKIRIYKDSFGFVHIIGRVEGSRLFGESNPIFNVPTELRPLYIQIGAVCLSSASSVFTGLRVISSTGNCYFTTEPLSWTLINFSYFAGL